MYGMIKKGGETNKMETRKIANYRIETSYNDGKYFVKVYNERAKKQHNQLKYFYFFRSQESADSYISDFEKRIAAWEKMKSDRKTARMSFVNPAKVGDILEASWGYDQTNVDYYQVTAVLGKMVEIREIGAKHVEGSYQSHGMADRVMPVRNAFVHDSKPARFMVKNGYTGYYVSVKSYKLANKINEDEQTYRSWYA